VYDQWDETNGSKDDINWSEEWFKETKHTWERNLVVVVWDPKVLEHKMESLVKVETERHD